MFCCIVYQSIASKYTKLEENFDEFIKRSLMRFEYEKSPLHTIVYGGTGTRKTYFVRHYLKLNLDQDQGTCFTDNKKIIIVCKDERDCINPESGKPYSEFSMCDINKIRSKNMPNFKNSVTVLDDMGNKLNGDVSFFTERRHHKIQMIVMCHKPAQIINTARMRWILFI